MLSKTTCRQSAITNSTASSTSTCGASQYTAGARRSKAHRLQTLEQLLRTLLVLEVLDHKHQQLLVHLAEVCLHLPAR